MNCGTGNCTVTVGILLGIALLLTVYFASDYLINYSQQRSTALDRTYLEDATNGLVNKEYQFHAGHRSLAHDNGVAFVKADKNTCFRLAQMDDTGRNGLGHRWLDIALVLEYSAEMNATPTLQSDHWDGDGKHGSYGWFPDFAGIQALSSASTTGRFISGLESLVEYSWDTTNPAKYADMCNIVFHSCDMCCSKTLRGTPSWCLKRYFPNAVSRLADYVRPKFEATPWGAMHRHGTLTKHSNCLTVTVHVREGDIHFGCGQNDRPSGGQIVLDLLQRLINTTCVVVMFTAEEPLSTECMAEVDRVRQLAANTARTNNSSNNSSTSSSTTTLAIDQVYVVTKIGEHPMSSLWRLVTSDIFIGSGSSFPLVAATLSRWAVYITPPPKENNFNFSSLHDEVRYLNPGVFARPDPAQYSQSIYPSEAEIGRYICDKVVQRRGNERPCQARNSTVE